MTDLGTLIGTAIIVGIIALVAWKCPHEGSQSHDDWEDSL